MTAERTLILIKLDAIIFMSWIVCEDIVPIRVTSTGFVFKFSY